MTIYTSPENFEDLTPSFGEKLGLSLGTGLGQGLQALLDNKIKRMNDKAKLQELQSILGAHEPSGPSSISDADILALSSLDPNLAKLLQSQKEAGEKRTEATAKREFERAKPIFQRADEREEGLYQKESALSLMENAVNEGNLSYLSPDNVAEITGIEAFRTGKGAQFISAGKEYFLGSLKRAGARPNQWIEQQIQKMLPKIGRSQEANQTVIEALKSELAIEKKHSEILNQLAQQDEEKYGYVKGNIGHRTRQALKSFADEEQKKLEQRLRALQSSPSSTSEIQEEEVIMIDPSGKRRAVNKKDAKKAQQAGYRLVK